MEHYVAIEKIDELHSMDGTMAKSKGSGKEGQPLNPSGMLPWWEAGHRSIYLYLLLRAGESPNMTQNERAVVARSRETGCLLDFVIWSHSEALPIQSPTETRTKQNKQKPLGFSLFL